MDGQPLISVIVPIYNVAPYLRKCLDSLKGQTLKDIEVICIDDGSTDESGLIADEYATDTRFRIIHTENRGLSAARNRGIDEAKADWLMFVDSDDWVDKEFCRIPYEAAVENEADLVIFQTDWWKNGRKLKNKEQNIPIGIVDEAIAHELGAVAAWNKLYRKMLFKGIQYPDGHNYEDYATTHKLVHEASCVVMLQGILYHHVVRTGSITQTRTVSNKKDRFVFMKERCDFLKRNGYSTEWLEQRLVGAAVGYYAVSSPCNDALHKEAEEVLRSCTNIPWLLPWRQIIGLIAWKIDARLFNAVSVMAGRRSNST